MNNCLQLRVSGFLKVPVIRATYLAATSNPLSVDVVKVQSLLTRAVPDQHLDLTNLELLCHLSLPMIFDLLATDLIERLMLLNNDLIYRLVKDLR